jgi:hypothetical protein
MQDGPYQADFSTPAGAGAGVAFKIGEQIVGGDSAFAWSGSVSINGSSVSAQLHIVRHSNMAPGLFGPANNFNANFTGTLSGNVATLTGTSPAAPGITLRVRLSPIAGL